MADPGRSLPPDIGSHSQEVRDAAAKILRDNYVPPSAETWNPVVAEVTIGDAKTKILEMLRHWQVTVESGPAAGGSHSEFYRLDDRWVLWCWYRNVDNTLIDRALREDMRHIWVPPPPDFTGVWITYFVNGQPSHEIHYKAGQYLGEFTSFYPNGSRAVVQHYGPFGIDGEDTGYFPSGRVSYRAYYNDGSAVGTWTWYNEDGSIRTTRQQPTP